MKNNINKKIVTDNLELPKIISDKKVFTEMTKKERTAFYALVNEDLLAIEPKMKCHQDNYKQMLLYPEKKLNQAFLENKFKSEHKWKIYVNVLASCLEEHIMRSLNDFQQKHNALTVDIERTEKRILSMQKDFEKYLQKAEQNEKEN